MNEKERNIWSICSLFGTLMLFAYVLTGFMSKTQQLNLIRLIIACFATLAFIVKFRLEADHYENIIFTSILIIICMIDVLMNMLILLS